MPIKFLDLQSTDMDGVFLVASTSHVDARGEIFSNFQSSEEMHPIGVPISFNHLKFVTNRLDVLRGIHWDSKSWKLVTCVSGVIQQIAVDLRPASSTKGLVISYVFDTTTMRRSLLLPPGVGNGFKVLSPEAIYCYALSYPGDYADVEDQNTLRYDSAGVDWLGGAPILSERDATASHIIL